MEKFLLILLVLSNMVFAKKSEVIEDAKECKRSLTKDESNASTIMDKHIAEAEQEYEELNDRISLASGGVYKSGEFLAELKQLKIEGNSIPFCQKYADFKDQIKIDKNQLEKSIKAADFDSTQIRFNASDLGDSLYLKTAGLLNQSNITSEIMIDERMEDKYIVALLDSFIDQGKISDEALFNGERNKNSCVGSNGIFSEDSDNQFFKNFSGDYEQQLSGFINIEKLRNEYAKSYCFPVLKVYEACHSSLEGESFGDSCASGAKACKQIAVNSLKACFKGDFANVKVLPSSSIDKYIVDEEVLIDFRKKIESAEQKCYGSHEEEQEEIKEIITGLERKLSTYNDIAYNTIDEDGAAISKPTFSFAQKMRTQFNGEKSPKFKEKILENSNEGFAARFHSLYAVCTTFREAAKYVANSGVSFEQAAQLGCKTNDVLWPGDLKACVDGVLALGGVNQIGGSLEQTTLGVKSGVDNAKIQKDYAIGMATGDQNSGIEAQRKTLKNAKNNALVSSSFKATQASFFSTISSSYPTAKTLSQSCIDGKKHVYGDQGVDCGVYYYSLSEGRQGVVKLFPNGAVNNRLISEIGNNTGHSLRELIKAAIYSKQEKDVKNIEDQYEKFYNNEYEDQAIVQVDFCSQNPSAQGCSSSNMEEINSGSNFGNIGFQNEGGGNFAFSNDENLGEQEAGMSPEQKRAVTELGNIMNNSKGNHIADSGGAPAAAKAKGGISGGGGGVAGSGGGGGGGSGGGGKKTPSSTAKTSFKSAKPKWGNAGGSKFAYKSGSSSNKKANTFGDIFGKKKGRTVASGVNDISSSSSQLFEKISKRYTMLNSAKRLE